MGAPKTTGTAAADCLRCAALLLAGTTRCSLCGWPVGAPFPPADQQLQHSSEPASAAAAGVTEQAAATDDADAPKAVPEAPSQTAAEAPRAPERQPEPAEVDHAQLDALAEHLDRAENAIEVITLDDQLPAARAAVPGPAEQALDPLTAPLEMLTGDPRDAQAGAPAQVEPPVADDVTPDWADDEGQVPAQPASAHSSPGRLGRLAQLTGLLLLTVGLANIGGVVLGSVLRDDPSSSVATITLVVSGATLLLWMAAAISFIVWVHQARGRVGLVSDARQRWSPTLSTVGWVIPIAGVFIGWQVLRDLWTGSDPAAWPAPDDVEPPAPTKPQVVDAWLLALVVATGVGIASTWVLQGGLPMDVIGAFAVLLSAGCLALVVRQISAWQDDALAGAAAEVDGWPEAEAESHQATHSDGVVDSPVQAEAEAAEPAEFAEASQAH